MPCAPSERLFFSSVGSVGLRQPLEDGARLGSRRTVCDVVAAAAVVPQPAPHELGEDAHRLLGGVRERSVQMLVDEVEQEHALVHGRVQRDPVSPGIVHPVASRDAFSAADLFGGHAVGDHPVRSASRAGEGADQSGRATRVLLQPRVVAEALRKQPLLLRHFVEQAP